MHPNQAPIRTYAPVALLALLVAVLLSLLAGCAPGWRERVADRADRAAVVAGAAIDCYAPAIARLVPSAVATVILTLTSPATASTGFSALLDQLRAAVGSPEALACAADVIRRSVTGERAAGGPGLRISATRAEAPEKLEAFAWWAQDQLPPVAPPGGR